MRWLGRDESDNVEDGGSGGGGSGLGIGGGIIGIVGFVIYLFTGYNPTQLLNQAGVGSQQQTTQSVQQPLSSSDSVNLHFSRVILHDSETIWTKIFSDMGKTYEKPKLVHFQNEVDASGCGMASSATGPFYCPADRKVYLDFSFFDELSNRFHAGGDFAKAYVITHEVGHHVQNLLGISAKMDQMREQMSETDYNKMSVKLELQADFYAGVWAHYEAQMKNSDNQSVIEPGDIESALTAANAIGDDRLQQEATGHVSPDSFTHGTSAQRMYWFKKGYETGDIKQGNTFAEGAL
ncbi:KPN_02809 family neutral zinc metallopeptidase [Mucilaginibacter arboris]|uniref:Metalloprotease n=1 Tax=Mucilaginibacter arboris TaxID=2682090 RepID=A0A7K1SW23_9SPHI|nr:neutral zinc metallopeptidase [Mucilaginibacter arboris]MVN21493.1 metalloprotease [Mucilaginibacter arboris]